LRIGTDEFRGENMTLDYQSPSKPSLPAALVVVAWLFIGFGIVSIIGLPLGVFVGRGLLRLCPGPRTFALGLFWILIILPLLVLPAVSLGILATIFPERMTNPTDGVLILAVLLACPAGAFWSYKILVRRDIRQLFGLF
jgi:ABC-type sugar transport system permease subunit